MYPKYKMNITRCPITIKRLASKQIIVNKELDYGKEGKFKKQWEKEIEAEKKYSF